MKREVRDQWFREAALELQVQGTMPTGRRILAILKGGTHKDYPQGLSGEDVIRFRMIMRELGYTQHPTTGRWQ